MHLTFTDRAWLDWQTLVLNAKSKSRIQTKPQTVDTCPTLQMVGIKCHTDKHYCFVQRVTQYICLGFVITFGSSFLSTRILEEVGLFDKEAPGECFSVITLKIPGANLYKYLKPTIMLSIRRSQTEP